MCTLHRPAGDTGSTVTPPDAPPRELLAPLLDLPVRRLALNVGRRYVAELTLSAQRLDRLEPSLAGPA